MDKQRFYHLKKALQTIILLGIVLCSLGPGETANASIGTEISGETGFIENQRIPTQIQPSVITKALPDQLDGGTAQAVLPSSFCHPGNIDIGAYVASDPPAVAALKGFESLSGRHVCSGTWYQGWDTVHQPPFPLSNLNDLLFHDGYDAYMIPQLNWEPWVNLSDISSGRYDSYLTSYANQMKAWGRAIRLRFAHEMIQDDSYCWGRRGCAEWYPWQDQPVAYVAAFRHVHDIFRTAGANNVEFVWCPNNYPFQMNIVQKYYPGSDYVDWLCMDGYNPGNKDGRPGWPDWQWFDDIFHNIYHTLIDNQSFYGDKPIMIGETASCEASRYEAPGLTKSAWIANMFQRLKSPDYTQIKAFYWFNINKTNECDWRIDSSPQSLSAYQTAVSDSSFGSHPYLEISGTVGVGGTTLSYTDGTIKAAISQPDGSYKLSVSMNWSGTVTPTHPCYTFRPTNHTYNNVTTHQPPQNYTATFDPRPPCKVTTGVFRPSNGLLYLKNSNVSGFADIALNYGLPGDTPVTGDWDGNGMDTIGVYRDGYFYLRNSNTIGFAEIVFPFGNPGDQPVAGDWNNDGVDTIGVYRNGIFYLRNSNSEGDPDLSFGLGNPGDQPVAGDWNNDGFDTTGVFRPSNGLIFLKNSTTTGIADVALNYGLPGDQPVTGDWDGDGDDTIGVYRNGAFYLRNSNTIGFAEIIFALGNPGDVPIAGNWDGVP